MLQPGPQGPGQGIPQKPKRYMGFHNSPCPYPTDPASPPNTTWGGHSLCPMKPGLPRTGLPLTFDRGQVGPEIFLQPGALILQRES